MDNQSDPCNRNARMKDKGDGLRTKDKMASYTAMASSLRHACGFGPELLAG